MQGRVQVGVQDGTSRWDPVPVPSSRAQLAVLTATPSLPSTPCCLLPRPAQPTPPCPPHLPHPNRPDLCRWWIWRSTGCLMRPWTACAGGEWVSQSVSQRQGGQGSRAGAARWEWRCGMWAMGECCQQPASFLAIAHPARRLGAVAIACTAGPSASDPWPHAPTPYFAPAPAPSMSTRPHHPHTPTGCSRRRCTCVSGRSRPCTKRRR